MGRDATYYTRLRAPSSLALGTSGDGVLAASLGNLFHSFGALTVKNFLTSDLSLLSIKIGRAHV